MRTSARKDRESGCSHWHGIGSNRNCQEGMMEDTVYSSVRVRRLESYVH